MLVKLEVELNLTIDQLSQLLGKTPAVESVPVAALPEPEAAHPHKEEKLTMTVQDVATHLNISKPRAYELCARDDFPSIRVSERRIVVPTDSFKHWVAKHCSYSQTTN